MTTSLDTAMECTFWPQNFATRQSLVRTPDLWNGSLELCQLSYIFVGVFFQSTEVWDIFIFFHTKNNYSLDEISKAFH